MKKKILLPTDFSKNAWNAIVYALDFYKEEACQFYILNAFSMPSYGIESLLKSDRDNFTIKKTEIEDKLIEVLHKINLEKGKNKVHSFEAISIFEDPLEAIKKTVEDYDIDMIVMGTKGETEIQNIAYGSLAIQVMEKSRNCPVLVVPENASFSVLNEIVFPTSYKTHFKKRELECLSELSEKSSANIRILHVATEKELDEEQLRHKEMLNEYFEDVIHSFHKMDQIDKEGAVQHFVEERGADLIAFINKKHSFFETIFYRPLVQNITYHTQVPVLVMHDLRN